MTSRGYLEPFQARESLVSELPGRGRAAVR